MTEITQELLKEFLDFSPETGVFTWKQRDIKYFKSIRGFKIWNSRWPGKESGDIKKNGYRYISILHQRYLAHRLAWLYVYGYIPEDQVDHKDRVRFNNSIDNLRLASNAENAQNKIKPINTSTGIIGVYFRKDRSKYTTKISIGGKIKRLGHFLKKEDAEAAYLNAKRTYHPFSAL